MSRLELIVIVFAIVLYLWWRAKKRIEAVKAAFRGERPQEKAPPRQVTLEKDPVTGVYRPTRDDRGSA